MKMQRVIIGFLAAWLPVAAQADPKLKLRPPLRVDYDRSPIEQPKERKVSEIYAILNNSWLRHLSPEYKASLAADPGAMDVNAWDEVPDSSWFTNRMGLRSLSFQEVVAGLEGAGPMPGTWAVLKIGDEGYTPKIDITDPASHAYVLKFDLPSALERNSAAERICTLILQAAGYHVPHNSIAYFRRSDLQLSEKAKYTNRMGRKLPLTPGVFEELIQKLKPLPDGRYRGLASLYLPGKPVGRFVYAGRRKDDLNDVIPHELRRSLRGFRVIASWINHVDVGDKNALDVFIAEKKERGYVRHYLLDFGSTMGSGNFINGPYRVGHEYIYDGNAIGKSFITLGAYQRPWEVHGQMRYPVEVGYFQAELFETAQWKPNYPNLAFEQMDESDAYWGAKIVTAFTDETIMRLAEAGEYTRSEVTQYVAEVLRKRRDQIGHYWFNKVTPLEEFALSPVGQNHRLTFRDLAVERGYALPERRTYRFWIRSADGRKMADAQITAPAQKHLDLPDAVLTAVNRRSLKLDPYGRYPALGIYIQANGTGETPILPVAVILGFIGDQAGIRVLGWSHAPRP